MVSVESTKGGTYHLWIWPQLDWQVNVVLCEQWRYFLPVDIKATLTVIIFETT
jgi:hypothetical protein